MRNIAFILIAFALSGCGSLVAQKTAKLAPQESGETASIITMPAQLRTLTIRKESDKHIYCAEPAPDVALSDTFKLVSGLSAEAAKKSSVGTDTSSDASAKGTVSNDLATSTAALELAGRSQIVLLAREFLFRTCEGAANGLVKPDEFVKFHQNVLDQITGLIRADEKKAVATAVAVVATTAPYDQNRLNGVIDSIYGVMDNSCIAEHTDCARKAAPGSKEEQACNANLLNCMKR